MIAKKLTAEMIYASIHITKWLSQFSDLQRPVAIKMLLNLKFFARDDYAEWLKGKLLEYKDKGPIGLFAVRKFKKNAKYLWKKNGKVQPRPALTQGSEDFIASIINDPKQQFSEYFYDHPSLNQIKVNRINSLVLIDDSIGSGERVVKYLHLMFKNKTFLSWWSGGLITIYLLSFARSKQGESFIRKNAAGSNYPNRRRRLSDKLIFDSDVIYDSKNLKSRWGTDYCEISSLCDSIKKVPKNVRRGYGDNMFNMIFYHSVPNNIPGILHSKSKGWKPMFPDRKVPSWIHNLLENEEYSLNTRLKKNRELELTQFLKNVKRGLRSIASISRAMDSSKSITKYFFEFALSLGFVTENFRITSAGVDYLYKKLKNKVNCNYKYELYVPESWCTD